MITLTLFKATWLDLEEVGWSALRCTMQTPKNTRLRQACPSGLPQLAQVIEEPGHLRSRSPFDQGVGIADGAPPPLVQ